MDKIVEFLEGFVPEGFDVEAFLKAAAILFVGILLIGLVARLLFGRKSVLNRSVSSAISILFIYVITIVVHSFGVDLQFLLSPLPFISISGDYLNLFSFAGADYQAICGQILSMAILAFLANLADSWLPQGKKLIGWFFFRCVSVLLAMVLHLFVTAILTALLPDLLLTWAPVVLLGLLFLMILLGALKVLFAITNPLFGALYAFFFGHVVGKMIYKAVLTTAILAAVVLTLNHFGISAVLISSSALAAYAPLLVLLLVVWYLIGHLL